VIRKYAPVPLIPAAWAMAFATVVKPGLSTYWIQHMHGFMLLFLGGFALLSWNEMEGRVMETWKYVIAAGFFFTSLGMLGFHLEGLGSSVFVLSILYWILAPAYGFWISSVEPNRFSSSYRVMFVMSLFTAAVFLLGAFTGRKELLGISFVSAGVVQAASIGLASYMDS